jgi:hypothetical protein
METQDERHLRPRSHLVLSVAGVLAYLIDEDESMSRGRRSEAFRNRSRFGCGRAADRRTLAEGAAVAIWPGERGRQRRADVSVG